MLIYIGKRIVLALLVAIAVSFISFMILNLSGDPAAALAGADAGPEEIRFISEKYGLDRPILIQYFEWVGRAMQGNFGESPYFNQPVKRSHRRSNRCHSVAGYFRLYVRHLPGNPFGCHRRHPAQYLDRPNGSDHFRFWSGPAQFLFRVDSDYLLWGNVALVADIG